MGWFWYGFLCGADRGSRLCRCYRQYIESSFESVTSWQGLTRKWNNVAPHGKAMCCLVPGRPCDGVFVSCNITCHLALKRAVMCLKIVPVALGTICSMAGIDSRRSIHGCTAQTESAGKNFNDLFEVVLVFGIQAELLHTFIELFVTEGEERGFGQDAVHLFLVAFFHRAVGFICHGGTLLHIWIWVSVRACQWRQLREGKQCGHDREVLRSRSKGTDSHKEKCDHTKHGRMISDSLDDFVFHCVSSITLMVFCIRYRWFSR